MILINVYIIITIYKDNSILGICVQMKKDQEKVKAYRLF